MTLMLPMIDDPARFAPPSAWTPASVSGLTAWYDPSNAGSLTVDGSNNISAIIDLSGSGYNGSASGSNRPVLQIAGQNGRNTMRFTAANGQYFTLAATMPNFTEFTFAMVCKRGGPSGANVVIGLGDASNTGALAWVSNSVIYSSIGSGYLYSSVQPGTDYNLVTNVKSGASSGNEYLNGADITAGFQASAYPSAWTWLGRQYTNYCNGEIAECLLYNSKLGPTDLANLSSYLKTKWGTP